MTAEPVRDQGGAPAAAPARSGFGWRLATAAAGIPMILALIVLGGPMFTAVVALALGAGFVELARSLRLSRTPLYWVCFAAVVALPVAAHGGGDALTGVLVATAAASLVALIAAGTIPETLAEWGLGLAGVLYVGLLGQHFVRLRELPDGYDWVLLAVFTTFATDTGAYAAGRLTGRHKLAPRLSPSKTVEGAVGGLATGALAAWGLNALLGLDRSPAAMLALGAAAAVAGQAGDLAESLIKRAAGVKDMGTILPGHGGVLDRLDSLLFVAPLVYYAARHWL